MKHIFETKKWNRLLLQNKRDTNNIKLIDNYITKNNIKLNESLITFFFFNDNIDEKELDNKYIKFKTAKNHNNKEYYELLYNGMDGIKKFDQMQKNKKENILHIKNRKKLKTLKLTIEDIKELDFINNKFKPFKECDIGFLRDIFINKFDDKIQRFEKYRNIKNKKAITLDNLQLRYGYEKGAIKYKDHVEKCKQTKNNFINRYGFEKGSERYTIFLEKLKPNKENFIKRYGEEDGTNRYNNFCKSNKNNLSLDKKIQKYGEDIGLQKYLETKQKQQYNASLEYFIHKWGNIEGKNKWQNKMDNMHRACKKGFSLKSQKFFFELLEYLNNEDKQNVCFMLKNDEYFIPPYFIDFTLPHKNKCIEYYGDAFHANPLIYKNPYDKPNPFTDKITCKDIWDYDSKRTNYIKSKKFDILIVWESEIKKDKKLVIKKCLEFINE